MRALCLFTKVKFNLSTALRYINQSAKQTFTVRIRVPDAHKIAAALQKIYPKTVTQGTTEVHFAGSEKELKFVSDWVTRNEPQDPLLSSVFLRDQLPFEYGLWLYLLFTLAKLDQATGTCFDIQRDGKVALYCRPDKTTLVQLPRLFVFADKFPYQETSSSEKEPSTHFNRVPRDLEGLTQKHSEKRVQDTQVTIEFRMDACVAQDNDVVRPFVFESEPPFEQLRALEIVESAGSFMIPSRYDLRSKAKIEPRGKSSFVWTLQGDEETVFANLERSDRLEAGAAPESLLLENANTQFGPRGGDSWMIQDITIHKDGESHVPEECTEELFLSLRSLRVFRNDRLSFYTNVFAKECDHCG